MIGLLFLLFVEVCSAEENVDINQSRIFEMQKRIDSTYSEKSFWDSYFLCITNLKKLTADIALTDNYILKNQNNLQFYNMSEFDLNNSGSAEFLSSLLLTESIQLRQYLKLKIKLNNAESGLLNKKNQFSIYFYRSRIFDINNEEDLILNSINSQSHYDWLINQVKNISN